MKQETKETIQKVLVTAAMVTPPWNIFWWTVGGIVYVARGGSKADPSGDTVLSLVLGAPVTLPMLPYVLLKERRELRKYEQRQALYDKAAAWIASELTKDGVRVGKHEAHLNGPYVEAAPDGAHQENQHAIVYALAVRRFAAEGLTIQEVCANAEPKRTLDRQWAEANGFTAWAEEVFTTDCTDCGNRLSLGWHFGEDAQSMRDLLTDRQTRVVLKDGGERVVNGHICQNCLGKIDHRYVVS